MAKKKRPAVRKVTKAKPRSRARSDGSVRKRLFWTLGPLALVGVFFWLIWPFLQAGDRFAEIEGHRPSRLYGQPLELRTGMPATARGLSGRFGDLGYAKVSGRSPQRAGEYRWLNEGVVAYLRDHVTADGERKGGLVEVAISRDRIRNLSWRGQSVKRVELEPPLLASYYGPDRAERRPVEIENLPEELIQAVLAAEDSNFFDHQGLSIKGIARAAWTNLRSGEVRQGGSTVTQQLVKNLFLSHKRTLGRKLREAALALLIDLRYSKEEILEVYLNEIYWGVSGSVNLIGVGSASWAYFGKRPEALSLCESALLAGMIQSPGSYLPGRHPKRATERRNWVLGRMEELGQLDLERAETARKAPLCSSPHPVAPSGARYFAEAAAAEAGRRFEVYDLADGGYDLFSTIDASAQEAAESAVKWGLASLEKGWEKDHKTAGPLQSAFVSIDPVSGAVRAWVGGRNYSKSQFDRVSNARRQAGSAFKPVVYAAAFESGGYAPASFIEDAPLTIAARAGRDWSPQNNSGDFRGWVTVRTALEDSLNVPTVRVAMDVGLDEVVRLAREMGVRGHLEELPSIALGAFEVTPLELATVYATIASGGKRPPVHSLASVVTRDGTRLTGQPLPAPARAMSPETAYLLTSVLQGVLQRGTAVSAWHQGLRDPLAGKTGTTNDRRDSWFVGYSPDRVSLVWVGYDDNSTTRLSGSRAALPIWTKQTFATRPERGFANFDQPRGIVTAGIDPETGELATGRCPNYATEVFRAGNVPNQVCHLHGGWGSPGDDRGEGKRRKKWQWLRKVFGKKGGP